MSEARIKTGAEANENPPASTASAGISNAAWNAFATIWTIAISFMLAPLMIRHLGATQYGLLLLVWSFTGILGIVGCGFGEATLRYVAHHHANDDSAAVSRVFGSTLSFYLVTSALVLLAVYPAAPWFVKFLEIRPDQRELMAWLLRLGAFVFTAGIIASAFAAIPMALQRYDIISKIAISQNVVRSVGYIVIALSGFGLLYFLVWDLVMQVGGLWVQRHVAHRLLPEIRSIQRLSFSGLKEIFGYSVFSFLTYIFISMFRESGKLVLGAITGPSAIAFLGTADNIAYRIHMVIVSGTETLVPRFSGTRDESVSRDLVAKYTWLSVAAAVTLFTSLTVLMPDFLSLWINPEFARESAPVGQCICISYIGTSAYLTIATFFRGRGKPGSVTLVMGIIAIAVLIGNVLFIPAYGVLGAGYALLLASALWVFAACWSWIAAFGRSSLSSFFRVVAVPLLVCGAACLLARETLRFFPEVNWPGLIALGIAFSSMTAALLVFVDWILGGDSASAYALGRIMSSPRVSAVSRFMRSKLRAAL